MTGPVQEPYWRQLFQQFRTHPAQYFGQSFGTGVIGYLAGGMTPWALAGTAVSGTVGNLMWDTRRQQNNPAAAALENFSVNAVMSGMIAASRGGSPAQRFAMVALGATVGGVIPVINRSITDKLGQSEFAQNHPYLAFTAKLAVSMGLAAGGATLTGAVAVKNDGVGPVQNYNVVATSAADILKGMARKTVTKGGNNVGNETGKSVDDGTAGPKLKQVNDWVKNLPQGTAPTPPTQGRSTIKQVPNPPTL